MPNPIKGEGVEIKISGASYPLIFSYDAITKIETKYDRTIGEVQAQMPRVSVVVDLLDAALVGYKDDIMEADVPPLIETQMLIQKALHVAYFGTETADNIEDKIREKKGTKKKK